MRLVGRNVRLARCEIDLLLWRGRTLVAVEVKTRLDHPAPERTARPEQLRRLAEGLTRIARQIRPSPRDLAVDVVAVRLCARSEPEICHFPAVLSLLPDGSQLPWRRAETRMHGGPRRWRGYALALLRVATAHAGHLVTRLRDRIRRSQRRFRRGTGPGC
jgi:Holliday junction resolvase-like predicted endonuclease